MILTCQKKENRTEMFTSIAKPNQHETENVHIQLYLFSIRGAF